jgi:hypothetical protein
MHSHHFPLGVHHRPAILGQFVGFINKENLEAHVQLPFVVGAKVQLPLIVNKEVLNANVQNLERGALVLVVSLLAEVPALDLALWGCGPSIALNKSNTIAIWLLVVLVSCWHLIIAEELHYLNDGLGEIVASLCHVVC